MKKKLLGLTLSLFIALSGVAYAAATWNGFPVVAVFSGGKQLQADTPAILIKGVSYVPLRMLRSIGLGVTLNGKAVTVTLPPTQPVETPQTPVKPELTKAEIQQLMNRLGKVTVYNSSNQAIAYASGFLLSNSLFVTNHHVGSTGTMKIDFNDGQSYTTKGGEAFSDESLDVYGVYLGTESKRPSQYLEYSTKLPKKDDKVYLLSNPKGSSYVLTEGFVYSVETVNGVQWIKHSCDDKDGSSGGALLNSRGEVIGVHSWADINFGGVYKFASPISNVIASIEAIK